MINAIFAVDQNGGMGFNGTLPWPHNKEDLAHFQKSTLNHVVVMGRRTWDDPKMPKPLKGRTVYIASNRPVTYAGRISGDLPEKILALEENHPTQTIWVAGGVALLESCRNIIDYAYLTHFKGSYKVDTRINLNSFLNNFTPVRAEVSTDFKSTRIKYESIFKHHQTNT